MSSWQYFWNCCLIFECVWEIWRLRRNWLLFKGCHNRCHHTSCLLRRIRMPKRHVVMVLSMGLLHSWRYHRERSCGGACEGPQLCCLCLHHGKLDLPGHRGMDLGWRLDFHPFRCRLHGLCWQWILRGMNQMDVNISINHHNHRIAVLAEVILCE